MSVTPDELAGIVGLFGALTREEIAEACSEVWFKRTGSDLSEDVVEETIEAALERYQLVTAETEQGRVLIPGPAAFPTVPPTAEDLPHILSVRERSVPRDSIAERILAEALEELETGPDAGRREELRQLAYDLETWAAVDAAPLRDRIDELES